jgi:glutamyl/glutaminyl-tRNA synthetase
VLLRIEDHDRQRSRAGYVDAILEDLDWLGFHADEGPVRQTDPDAVAAYQASLDRLADEGLIYRCTCTRTTFAAWAQEHGSDWTGPGCPGSCRARSLPGDPATSLRVVLGAGVEHFDDVRLGPQIGAPSAMGDLIVRDREANWSYGFAVVVDDERQGVDLVVRGEDLLPETARQIRLRRLLGPGRPPVYLHHPLIRKSSGAKLSKSDGDAGVGDLRAAGWSPAQVRAEAARRAGLGGPDGERPEDAD